MSKVEKNVRESFFQFCSQKAKNQTSLQTGNTQQGAELAVEYVLFCFALVCVFVSQYQYERF